MYATVLVAKDKREPHDLVIDESSGRCKPVAFSLPRRSLGNLH